jgi:outer membrane protein TolC
MFPLEDRFQGTWEVGVQMSVDLWDWNRRGYRAQQVEASWQESMERQQMTRQAIRLEVADARDEVERAADVLVASREREKAMEEVFRVVRRRHAAGEALTVEVLSTEHEFRRARVAVVEAEARYAQAHAGLDRAVGRMRAGVQP